MFHIHGQASKPPLLFPVECKYSLGAQLCMSIYLPTSRAGKSCSSCLLLVRIFGVQVGHFGVHVLEVYSKASIVLGAKGERQHVSTNLYRCTGRYRP
jgi:hypothetical protein